MATLKVPFTGIDNLFSGMRVIESVHALETVGPLKVLIAKRWMKGRNYCARVQKKWVKRWGYEMKPCVYQTSMGLVVHPQLMSALKSRIRLVM